MADRWLTVKTDIAQAGGPPVQHLPRLETNELHFVVPDPDALKRVTHWAAEQAYYLCTLVASDERELEDQAFKLYYVYSHPHEDLFIIFEHRLPPGGHTYYSLRAIFPALFPFECEIADLFGLVPDNQPVAGGFVLHSATERALGPARPAPLTVGPLPAPPRPAPAPPLRPAGLGEWILPVGPIHAGVIEAGQFYFRTDGEVIENLVLRPGYKHRGLEWLFQTRYTLSTGWQLAEKVSGDSSFAHALAYCRAVERLCGITVPLGAELLRALFLELERICNHINDFAALAHDMAFDLAASEIFVLREEAVRLCARLTGHRLLRGVVEPGGVRFATPPDLAALETTTSRITRDFLRLAILVLEYPFCRERTITTGILTPDEARVYGATGLVARASGLYHRDFRLNHPSAAYDLPAIQAGLRQARAPEREDDLPPEEEPGDVYARMRLRASEVQTAQALLQTLITEFTRLETPVALCARGVTGFDLRTNFDFALGYAEGWRGDVFYWLMKGPGETIFRCKIRDPSFLNWPALPPAVRRKRVAGASSPDRYWDNLLADFPLINKSFNLSYAGRDG